MINYKWVISAMDEYPTSEGLSDVVFNIHYRRQATEVDDKGTWFAETYSVLSVSAPDPSSFVPYDQLTEAMVEGWLNAGLDVASIDASLTAQIEEQKNPKVVSLPLPWNQNNA
jgi:hypothetical protein